MSVHHGGNIRDIHYKCQVPGTNPFPETDFYSGRSYKHAYMSPDILLNLGGVPAEY